MTNMRGLVVVKHFTGGNWVDSTDGILQVDITRGIPQYTGCWSQVQPGQLTLRSRDLSLASVALQTRIRIEVDGEALFTGKVFDISTEYVPREDSVVTLIAFDELGALSLKKYSHPVTIGHDYKERQLAQIGTFPRLLAGQSITIPTYTLQGDYPDGGPVYYSIADTNYSGTFNPPLPAPGASSDSTWGTFLDSPAWDVDGYIIPNSAATGLPEGGAGFGRTFRQGWANSTNGITGMVTPDAYGNIWKTTTPEGSTGVTYSSSAVTDSGHPLQNDLGFWKRYFRADGNQTSSAKASYAALMSTNDTDMLSLFLKLEQSEAGFAYVDAKNRFRIYSRAVVDNDQHLSKATFASDGTGISYNNITVTNGWESVVQGVTVRNTWSSEFVDAYDIIGFGYDGTPSPTEFTIPPIRTRGNQLSKVLNPATTPTTDKPKDYDWLPYNTNEATARWVKHAATLNAQSPIWDVNTRNLDVTKLGTIDYFDGISGVGTKQLTLNTSYAFNINTGAGYMWNQNGTTYAFQRASDNDLIDYNVVERSAELADQILTNYSTPVEDIRSINFDVHISDIDTIKDIDIYDRIDIDHDYAGFVRNQQYAVMGITHSITPLNWNVTYQLWNGVGRP